MSDAFFRKFLLFSFIIIFFAASFLVYQLYRLNGNNFSFAKFSFKKMEKVDYPVEKEIYDKHAIIDESKQKYSFDLPTDTPLKAVDDGVVFFVGKGKVETDIREAGYETINIVISRKDEKRVDYTFYGLPNVKEGDQVKKGDTIGFIKDSGGYEVWGGLGNATIMLLSKDGSEPFIIEE